MHIGVLQLEIILRAKHVTTRNLVSRIDHERPIQCRPIFTPIMHVRQIQRLLRYINCVHEPELKILFGDVEVDDERAGFLDGESQAG